MAWNRSDETARTKSAEASKNATRRSHGLIAAAIVVLGALAAAWLLLFPNSTGEERKTTAKERKIREVKPAAGAKTNVAAVAEKNVEFRKLDDGKVMKYVNGKQAWMFPRQDYHGPIHTIKVHHVQSLAEKCFPNPADRHIAQLLMIRPGDKVVGDPRYSDFFVKSFLDSFNEPVVPGPGDTDDEKELKRAVAEVKGDLKMRHEAGEDIAKIMSDTRKQLRQLSVYKRELEQQVTEFSKKPETTAEDIEDYVTAANKMLEDRGVRPIAIRGFLKHQIRIRKLANKENHK